MHSQHAMNIIIVVLLAMVMASVDQSCFGAPKNLRTASTGKLFLPCYDASCTIIGGGPETINLPETQFVCTVMCRNVVEKQQNDDRSRTILRLTQSQLTRSPG